VLKEYSSIIHKRQQQKADQQKAADPVNRLFIGYVLSLFSVNLLFTLSQKRCIIKNIMKVNDFSA